MPGDDYFSDDDALEDLPEDELHALEVAATIASTQKQAAAPQQQQNQWTTAPLQQSNQLSREDQEARAQFLQRQNTRRLQKEQQQQQQSQRTFSINPARASVTPGPQANNHQPSREQQQFTHRQRQLQPRQPYYQPTATYITQPTLPSTVVLGDSDRQRQLHTNYYNNQSRVAETDLRRSRPHHEEVVDPEQYDAFDQTVELWDAAGPTALAPQENLPGGGAGVVEGHNNHEEQVRRMEQERYEALADAGGMTDAVLGNAEQAEELSRMRMQLQQLLNERKELQENLKDMSDKALSKTGEAAILRSNLAKTNKEHERVVASLNALHVEEREKHKREVDALHTETERMKTESLFLKREVDDMASRNRTLERKKAAAGPTAKDLTTTPKKSKLLSFRDGFEDDEIMYSPTKASGGRVRGSPSKAKAKRKRMVDSPISQIQLPISQPSPSPAKHRDYDLDQDDKQVDMLDDALLEKIYMKDDRFEFYQAITTHRSSLSEPLTIEKLIHFKFPSEPDASISSIFLEQLTQLRSSAEYSQFPVGVCGVLFSLWRRCIKEDHFEPLTLIQTLLYYCLQISSGGPIYAEILDDMADYVMQVVDINGEATVRNTPEKSRPEINVTLSLELLDYLAQGLKTQERSLKRLWKTLRSDFPVMMLNPQQPIADKRMMLTLLQKSVFSDTYGTLSFDTVEQDKNQWTLLDVVGTLVSEPLPTANSSEAALPGFPQRIAVLDMRMDCLKFAGCILTMDDGVNKIASSPFSLKLVRRISDEVDAVYDYKYGAKKSIEFINAAVRLLYGVIQTQTAITNGLTTTLMSAPNGVGQKYVVAITRLAFAEDWMQELGLADDVIEASRDILENSLTPDEAEALWTMFQ